MFVTELSLTDFRNYETAALELTDGVTVFVGSNGQGKTNLVEAVEYLSTMSSHRVSSTAPLIRAGAESAVLRARVQAGRDDPRLITLELEVTTGRSNVARLNRAPLQRPRDLVGALRTVVFSPMDIAIVRGDPSDRRAWLDSLVVTRWPRMAGVRLDLDRVLRQRNALLKAMSGVGVFGAGLILSFVAFPENAKQGEVSAGVLTTLALTEPAVIMALQICGLLAIMAFPIDREVHEANLRKIAAQSPDEPEVAGRAG